ncbi:gamma carbonic anhydrase family protein [Methanosarcina sp. KYL-1]|uniref:gamma carbonic anhydrase family protein n=1 Tax=Methanosarcina sp. KYL-1 TaxID=2602068 RepID=UPI00210172BB|nr:gamma carbonic anhydrase family protein [Methanosarcina sp. KYL-1]MCQ1535545.1 gamma carbonic anhydrase family protein [Methanosarcina sp. KYL-1]
MAIIDFKGKSPKISETAFVAGSADIIGNVEIGDYSSIWFNAVIRGDENRIKIGNRTSIQDNAVIHVDTDDGVEIGDNVTVGHGAVLHGCKIEDNVLIGMNATVLNGAEIGKNSIVGANALVSQGKKFPANNLIIGVPAVAKRETNEAEVEAVRENAEEYVELAREYRKAILK